MILGRLIRRFASVERLAQKVERRLSQPYALVRSIILVAAALVMVSVSTSSAQAEGERRVALIIANSAYRNISPLPNPVTDAKLVSQAFKEVGFQRVDLLTDLDDRAMLLAIEQFSSLAQGADVAVIYYAGHGIEYKGENYLLPVDITVEKVKFIENRGISLSMFVRMAEGADRLSLVILDACRDTPDLLKDKNTRSLSRGLAPVEPSGNSLVVYSAKHGSTAADGDPGGNSPFAMSFASRLRQPGREIGLLFRDVRDDVMRITGNSQEPFTYGSISSEEFYFIAPLPSVGGFDVEAEAWALCKGASGPTSCQSYLAEYPTGRFVSLVKTKLADLASPGTALRVQEMQQFGREYVMALGLRILPSADGKGIAVEGVEPVGSAFGQLIPGDIIMAINSVEIRPGVAPSAQLMDGLARGRLKLLVKRGSVTTLVILRE